MIRHYRVEGNERALAFLAAQVTRPKKQRRKVWEDGYNAKEVLTPKFLRQKMTYCHENPCQPHWNLAASPEAYPWSGARYYLLDEPPLTPVDDARALLA